MSDNDGVLEVRSPSNRPGETLSSKCKLTVLKGEGAPEMGDCGPVTGIARENCNFSLPYKVSA